MGKAYKWFRGLLGLNKSDPSSMEQFPNKKWSFAKNHKEKDCHGVLGNDKNCCNAFSEVPIAVSLPSNAVVGLTVGDGRNTSKLGGFASSADAAAASTAVSVRKRSALCGSRAEWAAVTIQSHFRAYLSRLALRALKALVKLQALTRGYLVRKQTAEVLRRMDALLRVQERARERVKSSNLNYPRPATPEKFERVNRARSLKHGHQMKVERNGTKTEAVDQDESRMNRNRFGGRTSEKQYENVPFTRIISMDDEGINKILEIDLGKPKPGTRRRRRRRSFFHTSHLSLGSDQNCHSFSTSKNSTARQAVSSSASAEVQSWSPLEFDQDIEESIFCTANNSPQFYTSSSVGGSSKMEVFTPSKSDGSRSGYSDHPNYMTKTESSKAKARSLSTPKQRPRYERSSSGKRYSVYECSDYSKYNTQLQANLTNRAYPGSGRLDRLDCPLEETICVNDNHWNRY